MHIQVLANAPAHVIDRNIYGHFSEHLGRCIYNGIFVGADSAIPNTRGIRNDILDALRAIQTPVLRWPGGCFADEYHWVDGVGQNRKRMVNTHWGGVVEDNSFGTHEFMDLCELLGAAPYICGNVGSGTVREMQEWVEYITFDGESPMANWRKENGRSEPWTLPYFGVGNENWGCGGNMTPEYYANEYKRYATYVRNFGDNKIYKIACGSWDFNYKWTEVLMREAGHKMDGLSLHFYTFPQPGYSRSATDFDERDYFSIMKYTLRMDELLTRHIAVMDSFDPEKRVGLIVDEWGIWTAVELGTNPGFLYQQNSLRDALLAAVNFDIFNRHGDRVRMTNIAQTVNVLQSVILTDGAKMLKTPTYYAFLLYTVHHDATYLPLHFESPLYVCEGEGDGIPAIHATASQRGDGVIHITATNLDPGVAHDVVFNLGGAAVAGVAAQILTGDAVNAINTFECENVCVKPYDGATVRDGAVAVQLPPKSLVQLTLR